MSVQGTVFTRDDAAASVQRACDHVGGFWTEIKLQVDHRAWELLGYDDLDSLWEAEYESLGVAIKRGDRPALVGTLREIGQTQQQIADKLGVHRETVGKDLSSMPESDNQPTKITNARGQQRPASYQRQQDDQAAQREPVRLAKPTDSPERQAQNAARVNCERLAFSLGDLFQVTRNRDSRSMAIKDWRLGSDGASPPQRAEVTPKTMRAAARGLDKLADDWEQASW